jgi:hypothetical protein
MTTRLSGALAIAAALTACAGSVALAHSDRARGGGLPTGSERVGIDPEDFTTRIDNRYSPMRPGDRRVYRVTDVKGLRERTVVKVTDQEKLVANGVTARVVLSQVLERGELVEDNHAWFAQDERGNVWYFGELAREFDEGEVTSTDGSWESGVDGAQPGVIMPARPRVGLAYRQEYAKGIAQDRAVVFSLSERAETPLRRFRKRVLLTKETSPLDPRGFLDYKFYGRGVGLVLGVEVSGGSDREELVRYRRGSFATD